MFRRHDLSRREFLEKTAMGGAVGMAVPYFVPAAALGKDEKAAANDRIQIGLIGANGMGRGNLRNCARYPDVAVTGVCDVWDKRLDPIVAKHKESAKPYHDYRDMLQQTDIDAVIIATPPHWHAMMAIDTCKAGKDIFLQKPMTLHLAESLAVSRAVKKHNRICQVGTQVHARENYRRVVELVRSGNLGEISAVRIFLSMNQGPEGVGTDPNTQVPKGLDWNLWLGPAPVRPYNSILAKDSYGHASFMDYSGGWLPGMAPHLLDLPCWALELGYPTSVSAAGGRYVIDDDGDAPDTHDVLWQYPGLTVTWMCTLTNSYGFDLHGKPVMKRRKGMYFHGVNGTMYAEYAVHKIVPEGDRMKDATTPERSIPPSPGHEREWLDCLKTRKQPSCNVFYHNKVNIPIVLGNLALKLGRSIRFDPATEKIVGDDEAARLAVPEYRAPWKFPDEYI